jgi:glycosyltransferase involved in cell wall biosynthesis
MRLTVGIPSFRRPAELRRALDSLTRQERPVDEVVVVAREDDRETHCVAGEFASVLPIVLERVEKPGVVAAYNRAMDAATGDILSLIDDDAAPHSDWAKKIIQTFEDEPDLAGLGGKDHIFEDGRWLEGEEPVVGIVKWNGRTIGNHHLGVGPRRDVDTIKGVNMSIRMSSLGKLRMDERLRGGGAQWHCELKLCLDLKAQGRRLAYDPSVVVDHLVGVRHDNDQRHTFNALAYENQIYNLTLALLEYLRPAGRMVLLLNATFVGIGGGYCGILKSLILWPKLGKTSWRKFAASSRGVRGALRSWRAGGSVTA